MLFFPHTNCPQSGITLRSNPEFTQARDGWHMAERKKRLIVGVSGASGSLLACDLLEQMKTLPHWETHVVVTACAQRTLRHEIPDDTDRIARLADFLYDPDDIGARIASGSFPAEGMVVVPCSTKTAAGIHSGYSDNLLLRAADVTVKGASTAGSVRAGNAPVPHSSAQHAGAFTNRHHNTSANDELLQPPRKYCGDGAPSYRENPSYLRRGSGRLQALAGRRSINAGIPHGTARRLSVPG